jgi:N-formylglutamate deformylase
MNVFTVERGVAPLLISLPHDGTQLPPAIGQRLTEYARALPDTDWHVSRLYAFARDMGASMLIPQYSRYLVDLNRSPDDEALYPGQNGTGLCPVQCFDGSPIYRDGQAPESAEIAERRERYWQPYHAALGEELDRLRGVHARVLLWEAHSIRGECPFLFEGRLPDFNIGTADGCSCDPQRQARIAACLAAQSAYSWVVNGRFKGGYITRHYGQPDAGIDAVQLELAQRNYMDEASFAWLPERAARLQAGIRELLIAAVL